MIIITTIISTGSLLKELKEINAKWKLYLMMILALFTFPLK
jgi:hypothetical protein